MFIHDFRIHKMYSDIFTRQLLNLPIVSEFITVRAFLNDSAIAVVDFCLWADLQLTVEVHLMKRSCSPETETAEGKSLVFFLIWIVLREVSRNKLRNATVLTNFKIISNLTAWF
jgi:hypothetical protein